MHPPDDNNSPSRKNKRKIGSITDAVPIRAVHWDKEQHKDQEIVMWNGPPKRQRSPIICNEELSVSNLVYRLPRRRSAQDNEGKKSRSVCMPVHITDTVQEHCKEIVQQVHTASTALGKFSHAEGGVHKGDLSVQVPITESFAEKSTYSAQGVHTVELSSKLPLRQSEIARVDMRKRQTTGCYTEGDILSTHMPPRDPLCHIPIVTPPCPIKTIEGETPAEQRTYTHVSCTLNF